MYFDLVSLWCKLSQFTFVKTFRRTKHDALSSPLNTLVIQRDIVRAFVENELTKTSAPGSTSYLNEQFIAAKPD